MNLLQLPFHFSPATPLPIPIQVSERVIMVQPSKRSYYYFLSFAADAGHKKRVSAPTRRRGCLASKIRKKSTISSSRPVWDNTIHDLSAWKLSASELEAKHKAHSSIFRHRPKLSVVTSTGECSPRSVDTDDRSNSVDEGATTELGRTSIFRTENFVSPVKLEVPANEDVTISKLSVNRTSKGQFSKKNLTNGSTISRFGKENKILKSLLDATKTPENLRSRSTSPGSKTILTRSRSETPSSSATRVGISDVQATHLILQLPYRETSLEDVTCSSSTTVDFEEEVKQFETEKKQLLEPPTPPVTRPRYRILQKSPTTAIAGKKRRCKRCEETYGIPLTGLKHPDRVMDKSSPTRYTYQPSFRGGAIDSSDDSVCGPLENLRWHQGPQSAAKHRRPHSKKNPEAEGRHPAEKVQPLNWEPQPQKRQLVHFKGESPISDSKIQSPVRTKVVKRHFGSVERTSPIMEWNGDLEGDSDDHFSHQKDFQQYMVKCHHDLMKEFKDFKLSFSRQIMNLQLDVDKILANQLDASPKGFKGLSSHLSGPAAEGAMRELVGENLELPAYSSLKVRQEMIKPDSPSSGESYHLPSSKLESQYTDTGKGTNFGSWADEESRRPTPSNKSYAAPTESQVFRNLQNNPIYHVQTSSEKRGGSSDSDTSISSVEQTMLDFREARENLLEIQPDSEARDYLSPEELNSAGASCRAGRSQNVRELERKQSNGNSHGAALVTYGLVPELGKTAEVDYAQKSLDPSFRDCRPDNNGHSRSHHGGAGKLGEQNPIGNNEATLARILRSGPSKGRKDEISMSNLLGGYTGKGKAINADVNGIPDAELHLGIRGSNLGRSSRPAEKKTRPSLSTSRHLFGEEPGKASWDNVSTTSPTSTYYREPPNQQHGKTGAEHLRHTYAGEEPQGHQQGKAGAEQGRSTYAREEPQTQQYGKAGSEQGRSNYAREELQRDQQYGKSGTEQGRPVYTREEPQSQHCGKVGAEQGRSRSQNSTIDKQGEGEQFTLRGWAAAFLEPPTDIAIKAQGNTLQTVSPKIDGPSSGQDSPTREQSDVQVSPHREQHRAKENGSQYAVRQFAGKSSKGGCAWTVSEPAISPRGSPRGSPANGIAPSKGRQKHHYSGNNH